MKGEAQLQYICVKWFRYQYPKILIFAIPNGGSRNIIEASNLKRQGVLPGVPDLFIPLAKGNYYGMFIEMKFGDNKLTEHQRIIMSELLKKYYYATVCRSFDSFKETVENYINLK